MRISNDVANILANSTLEPTLLILPPEKLDRKMYVAVNKVLTSIGGKWTKKLGGHVFADDPADIIDTILITREFTSEKKEYQFFETPTPLAKMMVDAADIKMGESILEPSAGRARIASIVKGRGFGDYLNCVELNEKNHQWLIDNGYNVIGFDFLKIPTDKKYDVIIANPPFTRQQDIDHVTRMIQLAKRRVVSIMSSSVLWRDNRKAKVFRNLIYPLGGTIEPLPEKSFTSSGTAVSTVMVTVDIT